jgi:hypothetical protein
MITFTEATLKAQTISGDFNAATLLQFKQDINIGYHRFNNALGRYFSRKQQFTDIVDGQSIYQTPIDCIRIIGMTAKTADSSTGYVPPIKEIRSEFEWRQIKSQPNYNSNWIVYYYMLGNDEFEVWPTPSADITNGFRFYYQQQDYDLSIEDITSTTTSATVTVTNGSPTVTASSGVFTPDMASLRFQLTGVNNLTWYEIVDVPNATTLTLKSAFVGLSGAAQAWRIGQSFVFPAEFDDVPIDYALARFYESRNNKERAAYHRSNYQMAVDQAVEDYSSSTEGNVITDDDHDFNAWFYTPMPGN